MVRSISVSPEPGKQLEMHGHKGAHEPAFSQASPSSQAPIVIHEHSGVLFGGDDSGERTLTGCCSAATTQVRGH